MQTSVGIAAAAASVGFAQPNEEKTWKKAFCYGMIAPGESDREKIELAARIGLDGLEMSPTEDMARVAEVRKIAEDNGIALHSMIFGGWDAPLSSPDPAVIEKGLSWLSLQLEVAAAYGANNLLLVPAVVNADVSYSDAYKRSQENIHKVLPKAEETGVVISIENVWNGFLLSPVEFARYVDEFESPWVKAYLDVGNMVAYGWPEHWVEALGPRINRVHLKDYKKTGRYDGNFVNLREGDVNWPKVTSALKAVGYTGFFTCELGGGDEAYLKDVVARVDQIFAGE